MSSRRLFVPALSTALVFGATACGGLQRETRTSTLHIETDPKGAWISRIDDKGKQNIGQAPLDVEVTQWSERMHTGPGLWITTGILGALTGGLLAAGVASDDTVTRGVGLGLGISFGVTFLISLPLAIVLQSQNGDIVSKGYVGTAPTFEATLGGYSSASVVLSPLEDPPTDPLKLRLAPTGDNVLGGGGEGQSQVFGVLGGLTGTSLEIVTPAPRPVMAVFALEDRSKGLQKAVVEQLTDYIAARITEAGHYRVVPRSELRTRLSEKKAESYDACVDESCQIKLGKVVAAQKSLATRLIRAGGSCAMTMTLYDLTTEASETAATVRTACSEKALMDGIDQLTTRIAP